ncbi:MAG: hypothetical protein E6G96_12590 [Alphaproteobacteria bacterium]|nr:MAG: hypothetical protein E6G96_12590 [Alphaproteobacteria bacterium]
MPAKDVRSPPGDGRNLRVLNPGEQQKQSENRFHVDGDEKERIDVEIHHATAGKARSRPAGAGYDRSNTAAAAKET